MAHSRPFGSGQPAAAQAPSPLNDELTASLGAIRRKRSAFLISLDELAADAVDPTRTAPNRSDAPPLIAAPPSLWSAITLAAAVGLIAGLVLGRR